MCEEMSNGAQVAAALALGAAGVVLGTVLVVTEESMFPDHWKVQSQVLVCLLCFAIMQNSQGRHGSQQSSPGGHHVFNTPLNSIPCSIRIRVIW